ncbi:MAG: VacJ family lipoprotein [Rhodanobacteraceae bacterium]|nr:MAG: VacJ family lipoprotein [Rhodanobacteraceae bacterium]
MTRRPGTGVTSSHDRHTGSRLLWGFVVVSLALVLAACAIAPPRAEGTDDPFQGFNRKMYAFNTTADKYVMRPVANAYVKVTGPKGREHISDFFANLRTPVTIINEVLQGRPGPTLDSTARFLINSTAGVLGFFDPATHLDVPQHPTDFGVTLARWGVPEGPYLVLPFIGPTTVRDVWQLPVDSYFDPMGWYIREHNLKWHAEYAPSVLYLVTVRASLLPYDKILDSAVDPYAFVRDAYRQHRLYEAYYGNPPLSAIDALQGTSASEENEQTIEKLLEQQRQYEKTHGATGHPVPAPSTSTPAPASASSSQAPASASSANQG